MALLAFLELRRGGKFWWAFVLGIALGVGLLAKYAMIYFVLCTAIAAIFDSRTRELLRTPAPWIALAIAAVLIAPNILWNIENHFSTFRHTGDNVRGSGFQLNPLRGLEFVATQFGVFGPVSFAAIFGAAFYALRKTRNDNDRLLLCFVLPILALVVSTAFISRAHPNWAATAYVAGSILVAEWLLRIGAKRWAIAGIAFGLLVQVSLLASDAVANRIQVPFLTNGDVYRQTLGWKDDLLPAQRTRARLCLAEGRHTRRPF
jgi:4-amino-4-deoxy-L-arabinose transferase-like glycosyltransferase